MLVSLLSWVQNCWNFRDFFIHSTDIRTFCFEIFNSARLFDKQFLKITVLNVHIMLNLKLFEFLGYLLPRHHFHFFNGAHKKQPLFKANKLLFHVQIIVEWAVLKINDLCFFSAESWELISKAINNFIFIRKTVQQVSEKKRLENRKRT